MRFRSAMFLRLGTTSAAAIVLAMPLAAQAQSRTVSLDIPAQDLGTALKAIAAATGQQIAFKGSVVKGKRSQAVRGTYSADGAVAVAIRGSGLTVSRSPRGIIVVTQSATPTPAPTQTTSEVGSGDVTSDNEEIVVTGTNIQGASPVGSPLTVYDRKAIERTGVGSVDQFVRTLPQNFGNSDQSTHLVAGGTAFRPDPDFSRVSSVNLRGQGAAGTLVLLNGHRLAPSSTGLGGAPDVSLIPFSALERVELLTDGASAIYGADAVAGVVNFILKKDFDGAETSARIGDTTPGGASEFSVSQTFGKAWDRGGILAVYEHADQQPLRADQRDYIPPLPSPGGEPFHIFPSQKRDSVFLSAHREAGIAEFFADGYWTKRSFVQDVTTTAVAYRERGNTRQLGFNGGFNLKLSRSWNLKITGQYSQNGASAEGETISGFDTAFSSTAKSSVWGFDLNTGGDIFETSGGTVRVAFGAAFRSEAFARYSATGQLPSRDRDVRSAFAELYLPLIGEDAGIPFVHKLSFSAAGRIEDYSDFGSSGLRPKLGAEWWPVRQVRFRGSYGTSFHAPLLTQLDPTPATPYSYIVFNLPNAASPTGSTATIFPAFAGNPDLGPETSKSFTAGIDIYPFWSQRTKISLTAFNIDFKNRIAIPPLQGSIFLLYSQLASLSPFIDLSPDPAVVRSYYAKGVLNFLNIPASSIGAVFDSRFQNIASMKTKGFEFSAETAFDTSIGEVGLYLNGDYITKLDYRSAPTTPAVSLVDILYAPADLRFRGGASWTKGDVSGSIGVNYVDGYTNPFSATPVASWTTVDLVLGYQPRNAEGLLKGLRLGLSVQNLFDVDPPATPIPSSIAAFNYNFDATNASPRGRFIAFTLAKRW